MRLRHYILIGSILLLVAAGLASWATQACDCTWQRRAEVIGAIALALAGAALVTYALARWAKFQLVQPGRAYVAANQRETLRATAAAYCNNRIPPEVAAFLDRNPSQVFSQAEIYSFYALISASAEGAGLESLNRFFRGQLERLSSEQAAQYEKDFPAAQAAGSLPNDNQRLLCLINEAWRSKLDGESQRASMAVATALVIVLITASFFIWLTLGIATYLQPPPLLVAAMFAGAVGGFVSIQQRLYDPSTDQTKLSLQSPRLVGMSILTAPVLGGTGALVVYILFSGGLITGALFPRFQELGQAKMIAATLAAVPPVTASCAPTCPQTTPAPAQRSAVEAKDQGSSGVTFVGYVVADSVKEGSDVAKLLFWCFVAGFLERFVPDVINGLASRAKEPSS